MTENAGYSGDIEKLTQLVKTYAPHDGSFELPIKGARVSHIDPSPISGIAHAGLCIVAQWSKRVFLGNKKTYEYDRSRMVVYSMTLPIEGPVLQASLHEPYLCLVLDITPKKITELALKVFPHGAPVVRDVGSIHVEHSDEKIIAAAVRLMELVKNPKETELLSELIIDEIFIRLLAGPLGPAIARIGARLNPILLRLLKPYPDFGKIMQKH